MVQIYNSYSPFDYVRLFYYVVRSKLISAKIRIIRFPIDIRGRKFILWGDDLTIGRHCRIDAFYSNGKGLPRIRFGRNVQINDYVHIVAMQSVIIRDNVLIASHVYISDCSHGSYKGDKYDSAPDTPPINRNYRIAPVIIGDNSWIGEGVIIMPGVTIGKGCVIGAHSIVNKDVPDYSMAVGSPAKIIKKYNFVSEKWERI